MKLVLITPQRPLARHQEINQKVPKQIMELETLISLGVREKDLKLSNYF